MAPNVAPTGGDLKWTVDVLKATPPGAFATILSSTEDVDNTSADRTVQDGIGLATTTYVDGDVFKISVTVSGSTGSQGQGGCVELWLDEAPA